jgi:hypothetical protein
VVAAILPAEFATLLAAILVGRILVCETGLIRRVLVRRVFRTSFGAAIVRFALGAALLGVKAMLLVLAPRLRHRLTDACRAGENRATTDSGPGAGRRSLPAPALPLGSRVGAHTGENGYGQIDVESTNHGIYSSADDKEVSARWPQ